MHDYTHLRLIADDLTGALDSASSFVDLFPALRVGQNAAGDQSLVLNSASREDTSDETRRKTIELAAHLAPAAGRLCFFKIDSLLRGHAAAALDALLSVLSFDQIIMAPAAPTLNRITTNGRQHVRVHGVWVPTGEDLLIELEKCGRTVGKNSVHDKGLIWFDAAKDEELDDIVSQYTGSVESVLWVGTAGLASALANKIGKRAPKTIPVTAPMLGLIGSNHPVMQQQLVKVSDLRFSSNYQADIAARLKTTDAVMVSCELPENSTHDAAQRLIESSFSSLVSHIPAPTSLFVSGGETLQNLLTPLQVQSLELLGEFESGIPISRIEGGLWDGVTVVSKSGAFGSPDFLLRLVSSLTQHSKAIVT